MFITRARLSIQLSISAFLLAGLTMLGSPRCFAASDCGNRETLVGIYPSPFAGKALLARQVSAMMSTELLASLRSSDEDIPGSDFHHGLVEPIGDGTPKCSQLLLSGRVLPLGKDALFFATLEKVQENDRRSTRPELWKVHVGSHEVSLAVTANRYVFPPTKIEGEVKSSYTSIHDLKVCAAPTLPCKLGIVGYSRIRVTDTIGAFLQVHLNRGREGWLYLPSITRGNPVVNFSAAVVRVERGDFSGANSFLTNVIDEGTDVDTALRVNALLLRAAANELAGKDGRQDIAAAEALNPGSRNVIQIGVMTKLNHLIRLANGEERVKLLTELRSQILRAENLFSPGDSWLSSVSGGLASLS
jgi:hypothetical protein